MKKKILPLFFIAAVSLTACGNNYHYADHLSDYVIEIDLGEKTNFKILQLTDFHFSDKDDQDDSYRYIDTLVEDAKKQYGVDLIVVTGDLFTFASKWTAKKLFAHMDEYKVPWTVVFGNHDEQTYFSVDWMTGYLNELSKSSSSYCKFIDMQQDDVEGNCNFVIHLNKGGKVKEQLIFMDSNRYHFGTDYNGYDYFKSPQIGWYEAMVKYSATLNGEANPVKSLMFYHIPLPEINNFCAVDKMMKASDPDSKFVWGEKREKTCPPDENSGFFDVIDRLDATNGMFFGHDHINDFEAIYNDVYFCYGLKSTDRIYYDEDMLGYKLIDLKDDGTFQMKRTFISWDGKDVKYE